MEILAGVITFLNIIDLIFKIKDKVSSGEGKEALHNYLKNVGYLLKDVSVDMRNNIYPHQKCSEMLMHLNHMESLLDGKCSEEQIEQLHSLIAEAYQVEKLFGELQNLSPEVKNKNIEIVEQAAGAFLATAEIIKL